MNGPVRVAAIDRGVDEFFAAAAASLKWWLL
jgi:hypothetical protein